jgi:hypothetical protein
LSYWTYREELSQQHRLRRSLYELLRDELDYVLIQYALIDSYRRFLNNNVPYPFVEMRELKPRAIIPDIEHKLHNSLLVLFLEDVIPGTHKKYIRFFDDNRIAKENIVKLSYFQLHKQYRQNLKLFESRQFCWFLRGLLSVDYALLIQRDPTVKAKSRYALTHFHVRIDWPIAEATEDLACKLRYIQKDLYEKGDEYAENLQKKFFEYYGLHFLAGGRRTAASIAAQYLKQLSSISTVYIGSSESRSLSKISERGHARYVLIKLDRDEIASICNTYNMNNKEFTHSYLLDETDNGGVGIFKTTYSHTVHAHPPDDGKLRELDSEYFWLTVKTQHLLPRHEAWGISPLPYSKIYSVS